MIKASSILLAAALVAAIIYSVIITRDRDALNTELEAVQSDLALTKVELSSTKETLTSMQAELNSTKQTLNSVQNELEAVQAKLKYYEDTLGVKVFSGVQPPILKAGWLQQVNLINNPTAANPTWEELTAFLLADPTDDKAYYFGSFNCTNFAEMLHNNAEAAGIKAAFVAVHFEGEDIGHALNAFKTTDKKLVYVDCTGKGLFQGKAPEEWDKIAYVAKGKEYGLVSLEQDTPIDYASYEKMKADWDSYPAKLWAYDQEVAEYNRAYSEYERCLEEASLWPPGSWQRQLMLNSADLTERTFRSKYGRTFEEEEEYLREQREWLNSIRAQLEKAWEPLGIVSNFEIYW